jgi:hypothetical protein
MIAVIPEEQVCQVFDAKMILTESILRAQNVIEAPTPSCIAPAYVYIEGTHGKKFLCDYHYHYEVHITYSQYVKVGENIEEFIIDEREKVKETFAKNVTSTQTVGNKCSLINSSNPNYSCVNEAFVKVNPIKRVVGKVNFTAIKDLENITADIFYCNFHFRREYFRYLSNGVVYEDYHKILDERYRMTMSIAEETENIKYTYGNIGQRKGTK